MGKTTSISMTVLLCIALFCSLFPSIAVAEDEVETENATVIQRDDLSADAAEAAGIINQLRIDAGLPPLLVNPLLNRAATGHIASMIASGVYGHTGYDGSSVADRVARTGYVVDGWIGENWAVFSSIRQAIDWWMTDPPHRENLLNRYYAEMGIGVWPHPAGWGVILVVDFSTGQANPAPLPVEVPPADPPPADPPSAQTPENGSIHTVVSGDTLSRIGQQYGQDWQEIARLNGLDASSVLQIGQEIIVSGGEVLPGADGSADRGQAETAVVDTEPDMTDGPNLYTVQPGDSLWSIAANLGISLAALQTRNGLTAESILYPGQVLALP